MRPSFFPRKAWNQSYRQGQQLAPRLKQSVSQPKILSVICSYKCTYTICYISHVIYIYLYRYVPVHVQMFFLVTTHLARRLAKVVAEHCSENVCILWYVANALLQAPKTTLTEAHETFTNTTLSLLCFTVDIIWIQVFLYLTNISPLIKSMDMFWFTLSYIWLFLRKTHRESL